MPCAADICALLCSSMVLTMIMCWSIHFISYSGKCIIVTATSRCLTLRQPSSELASAGGSPDHLASPARNYTNQPGYHISNMAKEFASAVGPPYVSVWFLVICLTLAPLFSPHQRCIRPYVSTVCFRLL